MFQINSFISNKFGVFGLAKTGIASVIFLRQYGLNIIVWDDNPDSRNKVDNQIICEINNDEWLKLDYLILSPGIPLNHPFIEKVKSSGCKVISDIELLYLVNNSCKYIGITGTNGKSTTTSLINHIFEHNKYKCSMGGNIGLPVLSLPLLQDDGFYIFEMSSFQLDLSHKTCFNTAILLNITPDHLDRHGNMQNYIDAKLRIFNNQTQEDIAIISVDNAYTQEIYKKFIARNNRKTIGISSQEILTQGISVVNNIIYNSYTNTKLQISENENLRGNHNAENIAAAYACAYFNKVEDNIILEALRSFKSLPHRMQYLGEINKVKYVNDSKATNAESTSKALNSYNSIWWIVGGVAKDGGIASLEKYLPKIKKALLIGESQEDFARFLKNRVQFEKCDYLENAFNYAKKYAEEGDVVLLSPSCASYDQWQNFEKRGEFFIRLFNKSIEQ